MHETTVLTSVLVPACVACLLWCCSSIDSCMIGGVVANNSSGMCCGVSQNTYHTLKDLRVVFADGTVLDTADPISRQSFLRVGGVTG